MMIALIPTQEVHWAWPDLWPMLAAAVERSATKPNILLPLIDGRADLWAIIDDAKPIAAIMTQVQDEPERRCLLWMVGGTRMAEWAADFMAVLMRVSRAAGCVSIVGAGRAGWARIVKKFGGEAIDPIDGDPAWRLSL